MKIVFCMLLHSSEFTELETLLSLDSRDSLEHSEILMLVQDKLASFRRSEHRKSVVYCLKYMVHMIL